jgi:restriction system protein
LGLLFLLVYGIAWIIGRAILAPFGLQSALYSLAVGLAVLISFVVVLVGIWFKTRYRRLRAIRLADIEYMEGLDFEQYVCRLMEHQGYGDVQNVRGSGDFGVDILAEQNGTRYAVQVKRYKGKVSRRAVSDAVAGKYHFNCDLAMVVTNSYFTASAKQLAQSTNCTLVDRDTLADWILAFQQG